VPRTTELAAIDQALLNGLPDDEIECCPNCGHVLRDRSRITRESAVIVDAWLTEQEQNASRKGATIDPRGTTGKKA
jgi:hypothetical protein